VLNLTVLILACVYIEPVSAIGEPYVRFFTMSSNVSFVGGYWDNATKTLNVTLNGDGTGWFAVGLYYSCLGDVTVITNATDYNVTVELVQFNWTIELPARQFNKSIEDWKSFGCNFTIVEYQEITIDDETHVHATISEWTWLVNVTVVFSSSVSISIKVGETQNMIHASEELPYYWIVVMLCVAVVCIIIVVVILYMRLVKNVRRDVC